MKEKKPDVSGQKQKKDTKFKPGQSGNPAGRPPGTISITTKIKQELEKCPEKDKRTYLELLVKRILQKAIAEGDQQMIRSIWNYIDGMPTEKQELEIGLNKEIKEVLDKVANLLR